MKMMLKLMMVLAISICCKAKANSTQYHTLLAEFLGTAQHKNMPGASVLISKHGQTVFSGANGFANLEHAIPLDEHSVFPIASITKQFTAAAILLLAEQGKLSLDDNLAKYLPDYPTGEHQITLTQLLTHTAGLADYARNMDNFDTEIARSISLEKLLEKTAEFAMTSAPGERMTYSNTGYILLGKIIEDVSGQTYGEFLQSAFFTPLKLNNTYYKQAQIIPGRVDGYSITDEHVINGVQFDMSWGHAAGAIYSSSTDLHKWFNALAKGDVLNKQSLKTMFSAVKLNDGSLTRYGLGIALGQFGEHQTFTHGGHLFGFRHNVVYLPEQGILVSVLCNFNQCNPFKLSHVMLANALNQTIPSFKKLTRLPTSIDELLGTYQINDNQTRKVFKRNGELYTQRTGSKEVKVFAMSENSFFYQGSLAHFTIVKNQQHEFEMHFKSDLSSATKIARKL